MLRCRVTGGHNVVGRACIFPHRLGEIQRLNGCAGFGKPLILGHGIFFIATDYVTSPNAPRGQLIFGFGCGVLSYVIRTWAGYPEGVAFAVLLMNSLTPIIDTYFKPRIYGRDRKGKPLPTSN